MDHPLRVCYFGTYRSKYTRNRMMIEGLRCNKVTVIECHENLWHGIEDRVQITSGGWIKPKFWMRVLRTYIKLLIRYFNVSEFDVLFVGYPGHFDILLARILSWIKHKPLVWDVFMSIYLIAIERGLDQRSQITVNLIHEVEGIALKLPDLLIQDTSDYVDWYTHNYTISRDRFRLVPTGVNDDIFHPLTDENQADDTFRVIYYGTFIPNHGIEYIIDAARILAKEEKIQFELVGDGPEKSKALELVEIFNLKNITFIEWLDPVKLIHQISKCDICLGSFGDTPQALMTIHNKVYQGMAMQKAVITGDSPAIRESFKHGQNIYIVNRKNPKALADGILDLWDNPKLLKQIRFSGYQCIVDNYTLKQTGRRTRIILENLLELDRLK
jgi:glycosyltransferase involved in cell wall biosynthesis